MTSDNNWQTYSKSIKNHMQHVCWLILYEYVDYSCTIFDYGYIMVHQLLRCLELFLETRHITGSLQGAPFPKNCTMVSLLKRGFRGLAGSLELGAWTAARSKLSRWGLLWKLAASSSASHFHDPPKTSQKKLNTWIIWKVWKIKFDLMANKHLHVSTVAT